VIGSGGRRDLESDRFFDFTRALPEVAGQIFNGIARFVAFDDDACRHSRSGEARPPELHRRIDHNCTGEPGPGLRW
jgi:hypothetical protein